MKAQALPQLQPPRLVHKLTTADLVRFAAAAFILGITLGMLLPDIWHSLEYRLPRPVARTSI